MLLVAVLCTVLTLTSSLPCGTDNKCGGGCVKTCRNICQCDASPKTCLTKPYNASALATQACDSSQKVWYGGKCLDSNFCDSKRNFLHLEDCVEEGGPSCPKMVGVSELLKDFTKYDYRIDVRSMGEWKQGHANISIHTPGLSKLPADQFYGKVGRLTEKRVLVYCRSGGRAFKASLNLLKYGFSNVNSYYFGGFPYVEGVIMEENEYSANRPTKNFCYLKGATDVCPQPIPFSHINSLDDIMLAVRGAFQFVDVRPSSYYVLGSLPGAINIPAGRDHHNLGSKDATYVVFCKQGDLAFAASKKFTAAGFTSVFWIDNAGYTDVNKAFYR